MSSELRQRPGKGGASREETIRAAATKLPSAAQPYVEKVVPVIVAMVHATENAVPYVLQAKAKSEEIWEALQPYHPKDLFPALIGLAMVFFGGDFPLVIATVVAIQETGTAKAFASGFNEIFGEVKTVLAESAKDDTKDEDGNGVADVNEVDAKELVQRKMLLAAKTVDPEKLGAAVTAVSAGSLAVVASLKLKFARTLSLGSSLGSTLEKPAKRRLAPVLKAAMEEDYHKWIDPAIGYGCRALAMSMAFWVQRIIAAVHSAVKGGQMFTTSACRYLNKYGVIAFDPDKSNLDEMAGYGVAVLGLYYQLFYGTPFLLSLVLLPLTICEWAIKFVLSFA